MFHWVCFIKYSFALSFSPSFLFPQPLLLFTCKRLVFKIDCYTVLDGILNQRYTVLDGILNQRYTVLDGILNQCNTVLDGILIKHLMLCS